MARRGREDDEITQEDLAAVVNSSVQGAVGVIAKKHPILRNKTSYMLKHLDEEALNRHLKNYMESVSELDLEKVDKEKFLRSLGKNLTNYVLSGRAFDEKAQELILRKGLAGKTRKRKEQDYIDRVVTAFEDIYELFKSGDYAQRMPELAEAAAVIHDYGFLDTALDVLKQQDLMSGEKYKAMKRAIRKGVEKASRQAGKGIESYINRVAAVVIGLFGLGFLGLSTKITAAVVGLNYLSPSIGLPVGIILIAIAWILLLNKN